MMLLRDISLLMFISIQFLILLHLVYTFRFIHKFSKLIEKIEKRLQKKSGKK